MTERVIYEDLVGVAERPVGPGWDEVDVPEPLGVALRDRYGDGFRLSPPQAEAIGLGLLRGRGDYLACAPTNSGKTLIALLRVFTAALENGGRSVYVVPLKALAEEKAEEFRDLAEAVGAHGGKQIRISVTTGDYKLTEDFLGSPPPEDGEIVICTPERLEVMLRNPENHEWARAVSTLVIDEFHLLGDRNRGPTVECLLARIFQSCPWTSVVGLSATVGGIEAIERWFVQSGRQLRVLRSDYRYPTLARRLVVAEDKDRFLERSARAVLDSADRSLLVFVYRKSDAVRLAASLATAAGSPKSVQFFHAGLPRERRNEVARAFRDREVRVLVTTTSLKMGINTPATDVIVRDTVFYGAGRLSLSDIHQMIGRAGRGDIPGQAWVLCETEDAAHAYADGLASGRIEDVDSHLVPAPRCGRRGAARREEPEVDPLRNLVLTEFSVRGQASLATVAEFLQRTFAASLGRVQSTELGPPTAHLEQGKLLFREEGSQDRYGVTKLGRTVALCGVCPESGAVLGGFLRALIRLDEKRRDGGGNGPRYLARLADVDFLFLAAAAFEARNLWLPKPSKRAIEEVQEYVESLPPEEKPLVNLWRSESSEDFPTRRLLSTLRIPPGDVPEVPFYRVLRTAVLLHRHARGRKLADLATEYKVDEGTLENGLKPTVTWVLSCLAQICDSRRCYKLDALKMRILELIENLTFGATLGALLSIDGVGRRSVEKLVTAGYKSFADVGSIGQQDLVDCGLAEEQARKVIAFAKRRTR